MTTLDKAIDSLRITGGYSFVDLAEDELKSLREELFYYKKQSECDCVPCMISSKSCRKCGRKATIPAEDLIDWMKDYNRIKKELEDVSELR